MEKKKIIKKYFKLFYSIIFIIIFVEYIAPYGKKFSLIKPIIEIIDENNIDAGAIYYTDLEIFSEAEINMRNTMIHYSQREKIESSKEQAKIEK